jgi:branched-chain amino acid transport system permease protein
VSAPPPSIGIAVVRPGRQRGPAAASWFWLRSRRIANSWQLAAIAGTVVVLLALEPTISQGTQRVLTSVFLYVALAQSWNLIGGYTGYATFGQVAFYGIGAYTTAVLMTNYNTGFWITLPAAIIIGAVFAIIAGVPLLRLRGHYFAIATLGLATGAREITNNLTGVTGGGGGITIPVFKSSTPYPSGRAFFAYFLLLAAISVLLVLMLSRSRFGFAMRSVHQDEDAASALGVNTTRVKITAFALSAVIAAAAGAFSAFQTVQFYPSDVFDANITVLMVIMVVLGGSGSVLGPVVGAVALEELRESLRVAAPGYSYLILGAIIVAVVIFFPQGIVPSLRDAWRERRLSIFDNIRTHRL